MEKMKDPAIKLFGKEIGLPENGATAAIGDCSAEDGGSVTGASCLEGEKASRAVEEEGKEAETEAGNKDPQLTRNEQKEHSTAPNMEEESSENSEALPVPEHDEIPKSPSATAGAPKTENDQSDANNPQQKPLKKPDKILPCPRCNSMDTKFCYYNNYNINQPRHFCKSCQRYWTAGGTMRNVPVGAGRRKTKNSASHCHHITISEALQAARVDAPNGAPHPAFEINGSVLSFGPDSPLCESMASALNLADKKAPNGIIRRGFYRVDQGKTTIGRNGGENGDDCSCGSSVTTSNSVEEGVRNGLQEPILRNLNGMSSQIPCLHGVPWPYPWNPAVPVPAFYPPGFPIPIYPSPYWNCSIPGAWSVPWLPPPSPSTTQKTPTSTLGKHSREGNLLKPSNQDEKVPLEPKNSGRSILIPKTLRIDNPDEAARSSIWTTLGIKNDSTSRIGLFKAFQAKGDEKNHAPVPPSPLQANPAALSRSLSFQEGA